MKDWRRSWQRYRRQNRVLLALYIGLLALAGIGYALFYRMRGLPPEEMTNRLLIFLLWWFDLTLIAVLFFVLLRNLFKLALEQRHGILGTRFRTKLLLSYLALIIGPTVLLFVLGASLLSRAAASWFSAPVEGMAKAGIELAEVVRQNSEARAIRNAGVVASELARAPNDTARLNELERLHALLGNQLTGWLRDGVPMVELVDPRQRMLVRLPPLDPPLLRKDGVRSERFGGTVVVRAWSCLPDGTAVVVGEGLPEGLVQPQARLATAGAAYERLKLERPTITATAVLGFGGLALLVVFAAMWLGLYLSRRFTEPLLALVATTQRVAGGEELVEVPPPSEGDEVGVLVSSFNAMVRRLHDQDRELRSTVRRLDTVLGAVRTGVLTLDAARARVRGNPAAGALLGHPQLASADMALNDLGAAGLGRLVETIRGARASVRGSMVVHAGGVSRSLEVTVVPLGPPTKPEGWVVALEDMTQLVRAQRQAAWSEVARRIAHQIKNPLTPIRLAAERIARHMERGADDIKEVIPQGCRAIVEHVQGMQEMVDAFARYAKLPPVSRRPLVIGDLVGSVVALYQGVKPGLAVRFDDRLSAAEVLVDAEQFRQVLANLLDNAVEASPAEGEIVVELRKDEDDIVIEIADHGSGLEVEDPELLFQPFYSSKGRGSGMGLAVVQRIVADHGGTVRLEPNAPRGTRAIVRIPGGA